MIAAITQTLTEILVENSPLIRNVEIDLNHPQARRDVKPALSLYLYQLTKSKHKHPHNCYHQFNTQNYLVEWYDLSFVIIPWDWTVLGQWQLLSEVVKSLIPYPLITQEKLAPELRGFGDLPLQIATSVPDRQLLAGDSDWDSLFYPALYLTIQTPFAITKISN